MLYFTIFLNNKIFSNKNMRLLTIGCEYKGSLSLYGCGITSANIFEQKIISMMGTKITHNISLRGLECNEVKIINAFHAIFKDLHNEKVIIYYSGHGDHTTTKEYWQTSSGRIDQMKIASLINEIDDDSIVYIFSESCSSEHMCNAKIANRNYVSIGATQDYEDAIITCDGGVMTCSIVSIFNNFGPEITIREFWNHMLKSGVTVEHFSLRYSDERFLDMTLFY